MSLHILFEEVFISDRCDYNEIDVREDSQTRVVDLDIDIGADAIDYKQVSPLGLIPYL